MAAAKAQIGEFLRFFDVKRDLYVSEVAHAFSDLREARLFEDMYSKDDVEEIFGQLLAAVKETVRRDLETNTTMAALVLEQTLAAAEEAGVHVGIDMGRTEDAASMARVRELSAGIGALADVDLKRKNVVKLESMRDEHNRLVADNSRLAEEAAALRERYEAMQAACSTLTREKSEVAARAGALAAELAALRSGASAASAASAAHAAELDSLRAKVAELHARAESATVCARGGGGRAGCCGAPGA